MTAEPRRRSFCRYCGALTTYPDGCCAAHRDLLAREREAFNTYYAPDLGSVNPPPGEAASPTREKEA